MYGDSVDDDVARALWGTLGRACSVELVPSQTARAAELEVHFNCSRWSKDLAAWAQKNVSVTRPSWTVSAVGRNRLFWAPDGPRCS